METPLKIDSGVEEDVDSALIEPRTTLLSKEEVLQQDLENDGFGPDADRVVVKNVHDGPAPVSLCRKLAVSLFHYYSS